MRSLLRSCGHRLHRRFVRQHTTGTVPDSEGLRQGHRRADGNLPRQDSHRRRLLERPGQSRGTTISFIKTTIHSCCLQLPFQAVFRTGTWFLSSSLVIVFYLPSSNWLSVNTRSLNTSSQSHYFPTTFLARCSCFIPVLFQLFHLPSILLHHPYIRVAKLLSVLCYLLALFHFQYQCSQSIPYLQAGTMQASITSFTMHPIVFIRPFLFSIIGSGVLHKHYYKHIGQSDTRKVLQ